MGCELVERCLHLNLIACVLGGGGRREGGGREGERKRKREGRGGEGKVKIMSFVCIPQTFKISLIIFFSS